MLRPHYPNPHVADGSPRSSCCEPIPQPALTVTAGTTQLAMSTIGPDQNGSQAADELKWVCRSLSRVFL